MDLSQKQLQRMVVIENAVEGRLSVDQASQALGLQHALGKAAEGAL